eukprot:Awhi_evm1s12466
MPLPPPPPPGPLPPQLSPQSTTRTSSQPQSAADTPHEITRNTPRLMYIDFDLKIEKYSEVVSTFNTISSAASQPNQPRQGIISYALCKPKEKESETSNKLYFIETFLDLESQLSHLTENEGEAMVEMYSDQWIKARGGMAVGFSKDEENLKADLLLSLGLKFAESSREGNCIVNFETLNSKKYQKWPAIRPNMGMGALFEFRIKPKENINHQELITSCYDFMSFAPDMTLPLLTRLVVVSPWWSSNTKNESADIGMYLLTTSVENVKANFTRLGCEKVVSQCANIELIVTTEKKSGSLGQQSGDHLDDLLEYWEDSGIFCCEQREVVAGFLLNPCYTKNWSGIVEEYKKSVLQRVDDLLPFQVRYHPAKGTPEALLINAIPPKISSDNITVPLLHLLRKIAFISRHDNEVPIGMIYSQLSRLRNLLIVSKKINAIQEDSEVDEEFEDQFKSFLDFLNSLGYSIPPSGRVPIYFEGVEQLLSLLEKEYESDITKGVSARNFIHVPIPYMALQEIYHIGDIVTTKEIGALGGVCIGLLVIDSYYEPYRSLVGGRKFSFRLQLEAVLPISGEFVSVRFTHIFEEWKGEKLISQLPFQRCLEGSPEHLELIERSFHVESINTSTYSYHHYPASCFFPHLKGNSLGAASSGNSQRCSGRLVVDSARGIELGHSPANSNDNLGAEISVTIKLLKNVQRSMKGSSDSKLKSEKLQASGLRISSKLSKTRTLIAWPAVVAFSLTTKTWGHVLLDSLTSVTPSLDAWNQLVLPDRTKEMLLSMTASPMFPRYTYEDIVESKGGGVLFLLYGPPGTGKTLSVEALASKFGRPLYSISFAELGATVAELEERLTDVLALAATWKALVLLDEGDALVEKRQRGQFLLNSMTGVLLRLLESFDGALFITSNRASSFDPAALSRVTLAIKYEPLDDNARMKIWENTLLRIFKKERDEHGNFIKRDDSELRKIITKNFNLEELKTFGGSGRSVGAVMRLAIGLAHQRRCEMNQQVINDARLQFEAFSRDLKEDGALDYNETKQE